MITMTEKEVQARVDFKMNELLIAVENTAKANWNIAFQNNSQKHSHYWEAFRQMKDMLIKEMQMAPPFDDMDQQRRIDKKNKAVERIMKRFYKPGEGDYQHKQKFFASIIEDAQNW